jgi:uncharacterized phiE125 gp8 family phage protein
MRLAPPPGAIVEAMSLEAAKLQLRVDHDDEDELIAGLVEAALEYCEGYTRCALVPQRWRVNLSPNTRTGWNWPIELPYPPLVSVDKMEAVWDGGVVTPVDPSHFNISDEIPAEVMLRLGSLLPYGILRLRFEITCGYDVMPPKALQAIRLLIANWYENRSAATLAQSDLREPVFGVTDLLDPMRIYTL